MSGSVRRPHPKSLCLYEEPWEENPGISTDTGCVLLLLYQFTPPGQKTKGHIL